MNDLTDRQAEILSYLESKQRVIVDVTYREIMAQFGFKSTQSVIGHLKALKSKGRIKFSPERARGIELA